jgi:hypothetical protein
VRTDERSADLQAEFTSPFWLLKGWRMLRPDVSDALGP